MNDIKIGILTFHYAHNYGAVLQTYALYTYLRRQGYDVRILNYHNSTIASEYRNKLSYEYGLRDFVHVRHIPKMIRSILDTKAAQADWSRQCNRFERFIDEVILEGDTLVLSAKELEKQKLDVIIAGSDQIWNPELTGGLDAVYFLDFNTEARKIFYGASNGKGSVPKEYADYYHRVFSDVYAVSTREKTLAESIAKVCGKDAYHVLDPTLLLDKKDYTQLLLPFDPVDKFVFAYFITEDDVMMEIAQYISRVLQIRLIELHYYKRRDLKGHDQGADLGPKEFLYYMDNAEFIVTNSFHGTVFSILFEKRFYSVYKSDTRKDELLRHLNLRSRHINKCAEVDLNEEIDYLDVERRLKELRKKSETYIKMALADK